MGLMSPQIDTKKMVPLCRQLATSYGAGIPILRTLDHVGAQVRDAKTKRVLKSIGDDIRKGSTLTEAVGAQSEFLSPFFVHLLASGEHGGHLDVMLRDLADYFEDRLKMQRAIMSTLALPMIQLTMAWFLGSFALGITQGALDAGGGTSGVMAWITEVYIPFQLMAIAFFALMGAVAVALSRFGLLGWVTGLISTYVWPLKNVTRKFAMARFFRSFSLLIASGLPIVKCIEQSAAVIGNPYIERDLLQAVPPIRRGSTLTEALSHARYVTPLAREMVQVGEVSGNLDGQMKKAAEYHLDEASHAVQVATKVMGALIGLAVAGVIGYVVISFYSNLYGGLDALGI